VFWVYILRSLRDLKFYIGQTDDLTDRFQRHNEGRVRSTKGRRPFELIKTESYATRAEAVRRERYLKNLKGNATFRKIIRM
jgi:putative endonuclease